MSPMPPTAMRDQTPKMLIDESQLKRDERLWTPSSNNQYSLGLFSKALIFHGLTVSKALICCNTNCLNFFNAQGNCSVGVVMAMGSGRNLYLRHFVTKGTVKGYYDHITFARHYWKLEHLPSQTVGDINIIHVITCQNNFTFYHLIESPCSMAISDKCKGSSRYSLGLTPCGDAEPQPIALHEILLRDSSQGT